MGVYLPRLGASDLHPRRLGTFSHENGSGMERIWNGGGGMCTRPGFLQKTPGIAACYTPATPGGISVNLQTPGGEESSLSSAIFETTAGFYTPRPLPPRTIKPVLTGQGKLLYIRGVF